MLTFDNLTREQRRVGEFLRLSQFYQGMAGDVGSDALRRITGGTLEALSFFIESELHHRQAERYKILKLHPDRVKSHEGAGTEANIAGLTALRSVLDAFAIDRSWWA